MEITPEEVERKPYTRPEIVQEMDLEIRAGTPIPLDPLNPISP